MPRRQPGSERRERESSRVSRFGRTPTRCCKKSTVCSVMADGHQPEQRSGARDRERSRATIEGPVWGKTGNPRAQT
jgi:hypothetical protein